MLFASDNWSGASPRVLSALATAAAAGGPAYGADAWTKKVEGRLAEIFEHEVTVLPVGSGTAANTLALSAFARPGGIVFAHAQAHIATDEAGATEFATGCKIEPVRASQGKLLPGALAEAIAAHGGGVHHGQPVALSLVQLTELGAAYQPAEIAALTALARRYGMGVHMDGARFANAVAATGASPADLTWRAGVDILALGGTKNGCVAAEAIVVFGGGVGRDLAFSRQRIGHGFSKAWFIAAQLDAYLADGHWLELARTANARAADLARAIEASPQARLAFRPDGNEVFAILEAGADRRLRDAGAVYYAWSAAGLPMESTPGAGEVLVRLVTSWQTTAAEVAAFALRLSG
jgi:threonine aldolase